jgi:hypothetical protein
MKRENMPTMLSPNSPGIDDVEGANVERDVLEILTF